MGQAPKKAVGLRFIRRKSGALSPYWVASREAVAAGFPTKTLSLAGCPPEDHALFCERYQAEMEAWLLEARGKDGRTFDGTIGALIKIYQGHAESPYHRLKPSSRRPYDCYASLLAETVAERRIADLTGLDLIRWHQKWVGADNHIAAAAMALAVLKSALRFGAVCGLPGCKDLLEVALLLRLPQPKPRQHAPAAAAVEAARKAAHALGHHRAALAYALQFEGTARQWDIVGQWVPIDDPRPSAVLYGRQKWIGPTWAQVSDDLVLSIVPSKTETSTGARTALAFKEMPMVMAELYEIPVQLRTGPLIVNDRTGRPYANGAFRELWQEVRTSAKLPPDLWNRDLRAGGITEGGKAGATADDRAKVAGHSKRMTAEVYDRDVLEGQRRVAAARRTFREREK